MEHLDQLYEIHGAITRFHLIISDELIVQQALEKDQHKRNQL